ncbi:MAG TPA: hypothetical protein PLU52_07290 [Opitutaceae bacterium]|nr:hypothetical protein [Opitutaceae bacterium]
MSRRTLPRCPHCFEVVLHGGPEVMPIEIIEPRCAVTLRWHMACAHVDPLFAQLGETIDAPAGEEADPFRDTYHAILDRTAARDADLLPAVADVRRDLDEVRPHGERVTLRAPGASWGRPTLVPVRGIRRWP